MWAAPCSVPLIDAGIILSWGMNRRPAEEDAVEQKQLDHPRRRYLVLLAAASSIRRFSWKEK